MRRRAVQWLAPGAVREAGAARGTGFPRARAARRARPPWMSADAGADAAPSSAVLEIVANIGDASPREALEAWLEFAWAEGEGLPAFVVPTRRDADGAALERLLLPSLAREEITGVDRVACVVRHRANGLGLLASGLRGSAAFGRNGEGELQLAWTLELTPRAGCEPAARWWTEVSASGAARAFQARAPRIERVGVWQLRDYSQEADRRLSYGMPVGFRCEWRR